MSGYEIESRIAYADEMRTLGHNGLADRLNEVTERELLTAIDSGDGQRIKHERRSAYRWIKDKAAARQA